MSLQYFEEKNIFIKMSFYRNIVCKNIVCDVDLKKDPGLNTEIDLGIALTPFTSSIG